VSQVTRRDIALLLVQLPLVASLREDASAETAASISRRDLEGSFDSLVEQLAAAPSAESGIRRDQTDRIQEGAALPSDGLFLRALPSLTPISKRATALIISSEVSGSSQYMQRFHRPTWPGGSSGVTIGIGYDLGFVTVRDFHGDWGRYLGPGDVRVLETCCGLQADRAKRALHNIDRVDIPWPVASRQYEERIQPRRVGETETVLKNCNLLSPDSLGALVSLVYNRGAAGFLVPEAKDSAGRFIEMRKIRAMMEVKRFSDIPAQLRAMRRLWQKTPGGQGLVLRRELEAQLFSLGLAA
jgi:GH24 family phage-related lysozyme (muramidase)